MALQKPGAHEKRARDRAPARELTLSPRGDTLEPNQEKMRLPKKSCECWKVVVVGVVTLQPDLLLKSAIR